LDSHLWVVISDPAVDPMRFVGTERMNADFRRGVTCLVYTQFSLRTGQFFPVFSAFERLDLGAI